MTATSSECVASYSGEDESVARLILQKNRQLQRYIEGEIAARLGELSQITHLIHIAQESLTQTSPTDDVTHLSKRQRYQYGRRGDAAHDSDPFFGRQTSSHVLTPAQEQQDMKYMTDLFPSPFSRAASIQWNSDMDDVLQSIVINAQKADSHRCPTTPAVKPEHCSSSCMEGAGEEASYDGFDGSCVVWFGLAYWRWVWVAAAFNQVLTSNSCFSYYDVTLRSRSVMDCVLRWGNVLQCNQDPLSSYEEDIIRRVIAEHTHQHPSTVVGQQDAVRGPSGPLLWQATASAITNETGYRRSPFQCARHFQQLLSGTFIISHKDKSVRVLIGKTNFTEALRMFGSADAGALCLAANNYFQCRNEHTRDDNWIPFVRFRQVDHLLEYISVSKKLRVAQRPSSAVISQALLLCKFTDRCVLDHSYGHLTQVEKTLANLVLSHAGDEATEVPCKASGVPLRIVQCAARYAQMVVQQQTCGSGFQLEQCSTLLRCSQSELRSRIFNQWASGMSPLEVAKNIVGRDEFVLVVKKVVLDQLLINRKLSLKQNPLSRLRLSPAMSTLSRCVIPNEGQTQAGITNGNRVSSIPVDDRQTAATATGSLTTPTATTTASRQCITIASDNQSMPAVTKLTLVGKTPTRDDDFGFDEFSTSF